MCAESKMYPRRGRTHFGLEIKLSKVLYLFKGWTSWEMIFLVLGRFEAFVAFCTGILFCFFTFLKKRGLLENLQKLLSIKDMQTDSPWAESSRARDSHTSSMLPGILAQVCHTGNWIWVQIWVITIILLC